MLHSLTSSVVKKAVQPSKMAILFVSRARLTTSSIVSHKNRFFGHLVSTFRHCSNSTNDISIYNKPKETTTIFNYCRPTFNQFIQESSNDDSIASSDNYNNVNQQDEDLELSKLNEYINSDKIPNDIKEELLKVFSKSKFVPNIFLILSNRPDEFRAFFNYYDTLMKQENSELTIIEKEMIVVATSSMSKCLYCVVAHGAMLRVFCQKDKNNYNNENSNEYYTNISDEIVKDYKNCKLITNKQKAMLDYSCKLSQTPMLIDNCDIVNLMDNYGWSKDAVWDMGAVTSFFSLSNRMVHMTKCLPNKEFFDMARE